MKAYIKTIIMSVTLILLIVGIVLVLKYDVDFKLFKTISTNTVTDKKENVEGLMADEEEENNKYEKQLEALVSAQNSYKASKQKYDAIDKATIELVQEATADEKYFIEYLWIVLGNYARDNNLMIDIVTPGSKKDTSSGNYTNIDVKVPSNAIKIIIEGRYANVADFVYEVENDKELKFKLDNIKMTYTKDNAIQATFNVLNLKVKK